jgi:hypothetical protein
MPLHTLLKLVIPSHQVLPTEEHFIPCYLDSFGGWNSYQEAPGSKVMYTIKQPRQQLQRNSNKCLKAGESCAWQASQVA